MATMMGCHSGITLYKVVTLVLIALLPAGTLLTPLLMCSDGASCHVVSYAVERPTAAQKTEGGL